MSVAATATSTQTNVAEDDHGIQIPTTKTGVIDQNVRTSVSADDNDDTPSDSPVTDKSNINNDNTDSNVTKGPLRIFLGKLFWTPPWCRYDPNSPPTFSIFQNLLFAFAGAFTVANLYYNHPILNILADDFGVSDIEVSRVPTLMQSGYAVGLLLICPLGDLFPRRPYTLILVFFTATLW